VTSLILVSGGIRSGKSAFAERLMAERAGSAWTYWATGRAHDPEMESRIAAHRKRRAAGVETVEDDFCSFVRSGTFGEGGPLSDTPLLLDNLGFCVMELLELDSSGPWVERFGRILSGRTALTVIVTDEVGGGGVALTPLGRSYADLIGEWNQHLARQASEVYTVVMGCPLRLK
jgi:adenosylcobinamide kinase/adenosylcobinamide-phosphate guanylyltransferase